MNKRLDERVLFEALNEATDFVMVSDDTPAGRGGPIVIYVNRSFLEATGYSATEVIGHSYHHLLSPNNPQQLLGSIARTIESGDENHREMMLRRRDGSDFWIELVGKRFTAGDHVYRLSIGRDITLRRRSLYQVALLFAATEQSSDAISLYEPVNGAWELTYENEEAYRTGLARLPSLLAERPEIREQLERGENVHEFFAELDGAAVPALREFHARAVRADSHVEAIVTLERTLASGEPASGDNYESRLLRVAAQSTSLAQAPTRTERVAILRAILLDAFGADVSPSQTTELPAVHLDVGGQHASFRLGDDSFSVSWERPLESTALTAMRFCIEAAIELEALPANRRRGTR